MHASGFIFFLCFQLQGHFQEAFGIPCYKMQDLTIANDVEAFY